MSELENLFKAVCVEFLDMGFKKDIDPRTLKESFNIIKQADGQWFKSTKSGLHDAPTTTLLDLNLMPNLKKMTDMIDDLDPEIKKEGGRVFISENLVYKIKKGTQSPLLVSDNSSQRASGKFRKLCDEIIEYGIEKDRHRIEETYILSKSVNGEWSISMSHENFSVVKKSLNLAFFPLLKHLIVKIYKQDQKLQQNGGRIFITPTRIYRLNNKKELNFNI